MCVCYQVLADAVSRLVVDKFSELTDNFTSPHARRKVLAGVVMTTGRSGMLLLYFFLHTTPTFSFYDLPKDNSHCRAYGEKLKIFSVEFSYLTYFGVYDTTFMRHTKPIILFFYFITSRGCTVSKYISLI